jgi:hypothetical protein
MFIIKSQMSVTFCYGLEFVITGLKLHIFIFRTWSQISNCVAVDYFPCFFFYISSYNAIPVIERQQIVRLYYYYYVTLVLKYYVFLFYCTDTDTQRGATVHDWSSLVCLFVWGPVSGCTAACRLIEHTPCVFNVPTFTARRLHVTTTLNILAAKCETCWARTFR